MGYRNTLGIVASALVLTVTTSCANTRDPNPISMKNGSDNASGCSVLEAEYRANTDAARYKISKNKSDDGQDILLGVFIWPGLADFKNADGVEGNAYLDRNLFVRQLATVKECQIAGWPSQPSRYD